MTGNIVIDILIYVPVILIVLTFHELAHGAAAWHFGDPTAKYEGRLTLNPISHLDPIGAACLAGTVVMGLPAMGWAKPVPVVKERLDNPRVTLPIVALAGPVSNFIMGVIGAILLMFMPKGLMSVIIIKFIQVNISLGLFNLLPVPPLDGFKILLGLIPEGTADRLEYSVSAKPWFAYVGIAAAILLGGYIINPPFIFLTGILIN